MVKIYEKVREYIMVNGHTQVAIAKKAWISNAAFHAIMDGKQTLYADDLSAICIALNVSPEKAVGKRLSVQITVVWVLMLSFIITVHFQPKSHWMF